MTTALDLHYLWLKADDRRANICAFVRVSTLFIVEQYPSNMMLTHHHRNLPKELEKRSGTPKYSKNLPVIANVSHAACRITDT